MARIDGTKRVIEVLVNCKTYPAVSKRYIETVCTGGISRDGGFVRLYPIPFRLLDEKQQFDRWDLIRVRVYRDTKDIRPESYHLEVPCNIEIIRKITSERERWEWMKSEIFDSTKAMEAKGRTNGLVAIQPEELYWEPEQKIWTPNQMAVLTQGNLLYKEEVMKSLSARVPWQFKLRFIETSTGRRFDQKVLAWSYYQGFRRNLQDCGDESVALSRVRDRVNQSIMNPTKRIYAIFGTHSRFGHWMISGLYHVPKEICDQPATLF